MTTPRTKNRNVYCECMCGCTERWGAFGLDCSCVRKECRAYEPQNWLQLPEDAYEGGDWVEWDDLLCGVVYPALDDGPTHQIWNDHVRGVVAAMTEHDAFRLLRDVRRPKRF